MGIFAKFMTIARGTARESAQVIIDANAITIFEQEIVDVEQTIQRRKRTLTEVIAARKQIEREIEGLSQKLGKRENQAKVLIGKEEDNHLLSSIVEDIADLETSIEGLRQQKDRLNQKSHKIETGLQKALQQVLQHRRELRMVKAQQLASSPFAKANHLPEQLSELESTRQHVISLQGDFDDHEDAWEEMEDRVDAPNIDKRLADHGIGDKQARMEEIKKRLGIEK